MRKHSFTHTLIVGLIVLLLSGCGAIMSGTLIGKVVGITDGDTLTVLVNGREPVKVRLVEIDTPERGQPFAFRAKQILSNLTFRKAVRVLDDGQDRYGRTLGRVYVGDLDVNRELVRLGAAWVYREYSDDPELLALEADARTAGRGLWALPETERVSPWEWRSSRRSQSSAAPQPDLSIPADGFRCEQKRYCRQMRSCAEAKFYLNRCELRTIDEDRDGVPCEALCR